MEKQRVVQVVSDSESELGQNLLPLEPQFRERVWGGQRLRAADPPIGEAWIAYGESVVTSGRMAGRAVDVAATMPVHSGEAALIPAGMLHALGPGLLLYEIQQVSDTTYRAYDWDRPQSTGRKLHIEESVEVTTTEGPREPSAPVIATATGVADALDCAYFDLDLARVGATPLPLDTGGLSFHILTAIEGVAEIDVGAETVRLQRFETALVAGASGAYRVRAAEGSATLLRASVPV